ncbi:MAG: response regulator [Minicystis sp.]
MHDVLIVDDDEGVRERLAKQLRDRGYSIATAANGLEALHYLRGGATVSVVLLDLVMPVMTGWEFHAEVSKDPALAGLPVLLVTADEHIDAVSNQLHAPVLRKPFKLPALLEALNALLGSRPPGQPSSG